MKGDEISYLSRIERLEEDVAWLKLIVQKTDATSQKAAQYPRNRYPPRGPDGKPLKKVWEI